MESDFEGLRINYLQRYGMYIARQHEYMYT